MLPLTKFIGVLFIFVGLMTLFSVYETERAIIDMIGLSVFGLVFLIVGGVCWIWCEPYEEEGE